jgi:hypothetical protein
VGGPPKAIPLPAPPRVLVTYRPGAEGDGPTATAGDAVAIELLPDDYFTFRYSIIQS